MTPLTIFFLIIFIKNVLYPLLIGLVLFIVFLSIHSVCHRNDYRPINQSIKYLFWIIATYCTYTIVGLFTENEFTPNPLRLFFSDAENPFDVGTADFLSLVLLGFLSPLLFWIRSKTNVAIISRKSLVRSIMVVLAVLVIGGGIILVGERKEEAQSKVQYELRVQNNNTVRNALFAQNSPLAEHFLNLVIRDGEATIYFKNTAILYFDSPDRIKHVDLIKATALTVPGVVTVIISVDGKTY